MYISRVKISRSAILHNLGQFKKLAGPKVQIMPIIKSNAYGHGLVSVAKLIAPKVRWLGVVSLDEALWLRKNRIKNRLFVISYAQNQYLKEGIKQDIELPVYDLAAAKNIDRLAGKLKKKAKVHIKVDTGTTRVGIAASRAVNFIQKLTAFNNLELVGLYSHFASSEDNKKYTDFQIKNFEKVLTELEDKDINIPFRHFACSAAILTRPDARYNLARLGIGLYGLWPSETAKKIVQKKYPGFKLKPALTWKTAVIQVKEVNKGTKIGYGTSYKASKKMKIATLAAGYWEGYDRKLSNKSFVQIKNQKCPVVGRICMNLMMVDVSNIKSVRAGDEAVLLGKDISAERLAEMIGTINYEVVTRINPLLDRIFIK